MIGARTAGLIRTWGGPWVSSRQIDTAVTTLPERLADLEASLERLQAQKETLPVPGVSDRLELP